MALFRPTQPPRPRRRWVGTAPTYQYARPNADITDGSWTNESGNNTNLYASIDESVINDSDYIQSSQSPSSADVTEIGLSSVGDPGTDLGHVVRYRYKKDTAGGQIDLTVRLMQGGTEIASWSHADIGTGFVTATQTLTNPQAANITNYADLRIKFEALAP